VKNGVKVHGVADLSSLLAGVMPKEARVLTRHMVRDVASAIATEAKSIMPIDDGQMVGGTHAAQEKDGPEGARATVRVRGAFYWRFLERGDGPDGIEHAFFLRSREKVMSKIEEIATDSFKRRLASRLRRG